MYLFLVNLPIILKRLLFINLIYLFILCRKNMNTIFSNITERQPESGKVKSVVCKFCINYGKEENVGDNTQ